VRGGGLVVGDTGAQLVQASGGLSPLVVAGGQVAGMTGGFGTVTDHASATWFAGAGNAVKNNVVLGASAGRLYLMSSGVAVEAGLDAITGAPQIDANGAASTKGLQGTYSLRLAPFRLSTGAKGNAGPASSAVAVNKKKVRVLVWPSTVTGQTHWGLYLTRRGLGLVGPHFLLRIITLAEAIPNYEIDFADNELTSLAPFASGKPPACTHCAGLGPMMLAIGARNGYNIAPSLFNLPEEYDVAHETSLASKESVTGVTGRASDGILYVSTRNSLSAVVMSGNDFLPVLVRGIWENTGFAHGNGFTLVENEIYGMSGKRGPVRTQGSDAPDKSFAIPVLEYMKASGFTAANTHVASDFDNDCVYYASGNRALPFMRSLGVWSTPIILPGTVTGAVTINGMGLLQVGSNLFALDANTGAPAWFIQSPYYMGPQGMKHHRKTPRYWKGSGKGSLIVDLMANKGGSVKSFIQEDGHSKTKKFVVKKDGAGKDIVSIAAKIAGVGAQEFHSGELTLNLEPAKRVA